MSNLLIPGSIEAAFSDNAKSGSTAENANRYFQILSVKPIPVSDGTPRVRVILSDGKNYAQAMLNTMLNQHALSANPLLKPNAIINVTQYSVNRTKDKKFFLLLNFDKENVTYLDSRVGEPVSLDKETLPMENTSKVQPDTLPRVTASVGSSNLSDRVPAMEKTYSNVSVPQMNPSIANNAPPKPSPQIQETAMHSSIDESTIHPIASLTPYNNKWTIKARVISKSELKSWSNAKGEGKLFNMTLMDSSGEIKCTAFKDVAIMFHPLFEVGKVYVIGKGTIKMANNRWAGSGSQQNASNNYEMQLERTTFVRAIPEDEVVGSIPSVKFNFISIGEIEGKEKDTLVDVIGVIRECGEIASIRSKATQKQLVKRDLTLADTSKRSVKLTLWGDLAESFKIDAGETPIVAFKNVRITEFNGKSLSSLSTTTYQLNPEISESFQLRGWYDACGKSTEFETVSVGSALGMDRNAVNSTLSGGSGFSKEIRKPLSQWKEELPTLPSCNDRGEFFSITGTISRIRHTNGISYPACPTEGCNKKVIDIGMGQWKCEKCNQVFTNCNHRFMFTMAINDYSSNVWVNVFDEGGLIIFGGRKAEELVYLRQNDESAFEQVIRDCEHKMAKFRIKAKTEFYQGEQKLRYSLVSVNAISFEEESKAMLEVIRQFDTK